MTLRVQKKMTRKRVKQKNRVHRKKNSENKKESEKKIESGKNERKTKKQGSFYAKASDVKNVFIQTSLYLYCCTKRYVLTLMNMTNLCLVLLFLCFRNMRM